MWDLSANERLGHDPLTVDTLAVWSVEFSPDGKLLVTGSSRDYFSLDWWDAATRVRHAYPPLAMNRSNVRSVSFSPDGKILAAGYYLGRGSVSGVVLWDVAARKPYVDDPISMREGAVRSVSFSPDGKTLAAGYWGNRAAIGGVLLCDVAPESWLRRAAQIANRNFTKMEWRQYFPDEAYRKTFPDLPSPVEITSNDALTPLRATPDRSKENSK
jgi:WD40 repeat protein